MVKLNIYNRLFIAFFAILVMIIILKVPHENNSMASKNGNVSVTKSK